MRTGSWCPGGSAQRGIEGKIQAVNYAREMRVPFLGICLGMQLAIVEFARHVCGLEGGQQHRVQPGNPIPGHRPHGRTEDASQDKGGTMRLGAYPAVLQEGSLAHQAYQELQISERHRHRYEVNNDYREQLAEKGMVFSAAFPPTENWWRSRSCPTTPGSWGASSTRS